MGFRWYCTNYANLKGLTGWVRNLSDGTVEAEIQGSGDGISGLVEYMSCRPYVEIDSTEITDIPLDSSEWEFQEKGC